MEASRHNQFAATQLQSTHRTVSTKRQMKSPKNHQWHNTPDHHKNPFKEETVTKLTIDPELATQPPFIIGRPSDCLSLDQDLENSHLCQIFCCTVSSPVIPPPESPNSIYGDKNNKSGGPILSINMERSKIGVPFHSTTNEIDKRQKRNAYDIAGEISSLDLTEDQVFLIILQGRNFNTTLTHKYLLSTSNPHNYSYAVPISKYMPDEFINLIFR